MTNFVLKRIFYKIPIHNHDNTIGTFKEENSEINFSKRIFYTRKVFNKTFFK